MNIFTITFGHGMISLLEKNSQPKNYKTIQWNNTNTPDNWLLTIRMMNIMKLQQEYWHKMMDYFKPSKIMLQQVKN